MRILHLLSQTELTGAETYAAQAIALQARDDHQVFVISDKIHTPMQAEHISWPIATNSFWQRMNNILKIRAFLKNKKIQVIHCHSRGAVRHAYWARIGLPVGLTTTLHGEQHFSFSKKFLHLYGEVLIAVCENIKTSMVIKFGTPRSVIRIIRNPVSLKSQPEPPTEIQSHSAPQLALAGRSTGPKGMNFEKLGFHYFKAWLDHVPGLKISLITPNPEKFSKNFQTHLAKLNAQYPNQILVLGEVKNLAESLSTYDLVLASGRIAIETLLSQRKLLAMGEFCSHGLIDSTNYSQALASNFGDIGDGEKKSEIDYLQVSKDVLRFFQNPHLKKEETQILRDRANQDFASENVHHKILEVYRGAIFKRHHPAWIPILMYHKVPDEKLETRHRIFVIKDDFIKHLQFFKRRGFETLNFKDLLQFWDLKKPMSQFPKKPLMLTFDDGYIDNLKTVQPLLQKMNMKASIFLLADHSITENTWDADTGEAPAKLMNLQEKQQLDPAVFEIGSHGFNHVHLTENKSVAFHEMHSSKVKLEQDFKTDVISFAYPFGSTDLELAEDCFSSGYRFAVNTDQGGLHLGDHPQFLFRVNIFPEETNFSLWKKTSTWYRKYFFNKRGR